MKHIHVLMFSVLLAPAVVCAAQPDNPGPSINIPGTWERTEHGNSQNAHLRSPTGQQVTVSDFGGRAELAPADFERAVQATMDVQVRIIRRLLGEDAVFTDPEIETRGNSSHARTLRAQGRARNEQIAVRVDATPRRLRVTFVHEPNARSAADFQAWARAILAGVQ